MYPTSVGVRYGIGVQAESISRPGSFATSLIETSLMKLIFSANEKINFELGRYNVIIVTVAKNALTIRYLCTLRK